MAAKPKPKPAQAGVMVRVLKPGVSNGQGGDHPVGADIEVTPEQAKSLRATGYAQ
jgi:hypothetical protein